MPPRTPADLMAALREQLGFLAASVDTYDKGQISEAKRLAVTARLLIHQTPRSPSLFGQLGSAAPLLPDTRPVRPPAGMPSVIETSLLAPICADGKVRPLCLVREPPPTVPFGPWQEWLRQDVILMPASGDLGPSNVTRHDIVKRLANKEGGAHLDPHAASTDHWITRGSHSTASGWDIVVMPPDAGPPTVDHPGRLVREVEGQLIAPTMRQIAHELLVGCVRMFTDSA